MAIHRLFLTVLLLGTVLGLVACGPLSIRNAETGHYIPLSQPVLVLHREVVVPPERTRVFFQSGELLPAINEFQPHCELAVRELVDRPQVIQADHFTVTRVSSMTEYVVDAGGVLLAGLGYIHGDIYLTGGDGDGDGESPLMKLYIMWLHSERQPQVQTLICGGAFDSPALAVRPTLQDIATALGEYATFTPQ